MKMVTISEAKSKLSALIEAAEAGEEVLIFRGSRPALMLRPVSEDDVMLAPEFSEKTLDSFEREIERDRKTGRLQTQDQYLRPIDLPLGLGYFAVRTNNALKQNCI